MVDALSASTLSMDAVRHAVVRYGNAARDLALAPDEMVAPLKAAVVRCRAHVSEAEQAALETSVAWWAIHGYHRAD